MFDTLIDRISELAHTHSDKLAVAFKKEQLTYSQLDARIKLVGHRLSNMGIHKNNRILFTAISKPEMVVAYLGIQYCGAVPVFIDKNTTPENAVFIYEDTAATLFLTDKPMKEYEKKCHMYSLKGICEIPDGYSRIQDNSFVYEIPKEEDIAELLFTTGTTGTPKGVILTYRSVYHILKNTIAGTNMQEDERMLLPLPLNHSFALRVLRAVLYQGATLILQNGFTFAKEIENNLNAYQCTALAVVPASIETISRQMAERFTKILGQFRYIEVGAGSLTLEQRKRLIELLPHTLIYNTWGSSETGGVFFLHVTEITTDPQRAGMLGKPLQGIQVKILDENGQEIQSSRKRPGQMALKGDMQMAGYWNRDDLTRKTLKDGWLRTNDMVYMDTAGFIYMLGRADDMINAGGEKISPIEVENVASSYPHIQECACIGVPDPKGIMGYVPILFVSAKSYAFAEDDLRTYLASHMERYKLPVYYVQIQQLPRNQMQKIDRIALKKMWEENGQKDLMNPVIQSIFARRSIRKFKEIPIPHNILEMILKAGYYAPSGHNMQTWRFTVIESKDKITLLKAATVETAKNHRVYCYGFENPACIILISNDMRNPDGCQDASCAAENIFLAAHSYGIGSVWLNALMTLRDQEPVKSVLDSFGIPGNHAIWCMVALGYPLTEGIFLEKKKDVVVWM